MIFSIVSIGALLTGCTNAAIVPSPWWLNPDCSGVSQYYYSGSEDGCETTCQDISTYDIHGVQYSSIEYPNQQMLLYLSSDCSGPVYAAISNGYGASAGVNNCVPSTQDALGSWKVIAYKTNPQEGGDPDCPGTQALPTAPFPSPTG